VLGVLVAISLLGIGFYYLESRGLTSAGGSGGVATVSTTGVGCNNASLPQAAMTAELSTNFTSLSNGRCYNYFGQTGSAGGNLTLSFVYYNGTITYPCGTSPVQVPESEIQVVVAPNGNVVSAQQVVPSGFDREGECDTSLAVRVVSLGDVESTIPAVPQLNLTLAAGGGRPIVSLRAVLALDGGSQTFQFNGVSSSSPLVSSKTVSLTEIVFSGVTFASNEVYPMTISGAFDNGQTFSFVVHAQIANVP
jgi:hypothetical protein